jgi:hypothetical protein
METDDLPWGDLEASRSNRRLQRKHPIAEGKKLYLAAASACPTCQSPPDSLGWFYFESPAQTWEMLCGCAGWMVVCDKCHRQVSFFEEAIS